jgi:hypothetical protein
MKKKESDNRHEEKKRIGGEFICFEKKTKVEASSSTRKESEAN